MSINSELTNIPKELPTIPEAQLYVNTNKSTNGTYIVLTVEGVYNREGKTFAGTVVYSDNHLLCVGERDTFAVNMFLPLDPTSTITLNN